MFASVAEWITASAAIATVLIYIVLAAYARSQVGEARRLREEQSRPFVIVEFLPDFIIGFRIQNIGATIARNVRVTWPEWPEVTRHFADDPVWADASTSPLFSGVIPSLAPSQELTTLFDHFPARVEQGLQMRYAVKIDYSNFAAGTSDEVHYSEDFVLDLDIYRGLRKIGRKDINDVAGELEKIRKNVSKWTDGNRGIKVMAVSRARWSAREYRPMKWDESKKAWRDGKSRGLAKYVVNEVRHKYGLHGWGEW